MEKTEFDQKFDETLSLYGEEGLPENLKKALWDKAIETYLDSGDISREQSEEWINPFK